MDREIPSPEQLNSLYNAYMGFTDIMAAKHSAPELAGVMMAIAMQIYKSILSPQDFDEIMENIMDSKDNIKPFTHLGKGTTLQ